MKKKTKWILLSVGLLLLIGVLVVPALTRKPQTEAVYLRDLTFSRSEQAETIDEAFIHQKIGVVTEKVPRSQKLKTNGTSNFISQGTKIYLYAPKEATDQNSSFYGAVYKDKNEKYQLLICQSTEENARRFFSLYQDYLTVSYHDFLASLKKGNGIIEKQ
ncbi:hypothetical protein ACFQHW_07210 [Lapidilactobacillus achengensis]|uniref:Uncharacterized protein n=1 Tax=Lapidilactobacillus achengensis TaxID=2486000 RepID=A0ABW1UQU0_9LACO|nr:hypothetical protein [Lapidilactobacillus achengensis]